MHSCHVFFAARCNCDPCGYVVVFFCVCDSTCYVVGPSVYTSERLTHLWGGGATTPYVHNMTKRMPFVSAGRKEDLYVFVCVCECVHTLYMNMVAQSLVLMAYCFF